MKKEENRLNYTQLTTEQLLECYDIIFKERHSDGFKMDEIRDLLIEADYWFFIQPNENWKVDVIKYLTNINYDINSVEIINRW